MLFGCLPVARVLSISSESLSSIKFLTSSFNIDTDLRLAMIATIREFYATEPSKFDLREYLGPARTAVKELVKHKMSVLGTAGHT